MYDWSVDTNTISFANPVEDFGAYWGEATGESLPDPDTVSVSFYDSFDDLIGSASFPYSHSATGDGALDWHGWSSSVGISSITYSGVFVVVDGLQATSVPEPSTLALLAAGAIAVVGYSWRRRRARA